MELSDSCLSSGLGVTTSFAQARRAPRTSLGYCESILNDMDLVSRRAEEAALRRFEAASWLIEMLGNVDLCLEPSEEELRCFLRNGRVFCNVMNIIHAREVSKATSSDDGILPAYQHSENMRKFLSAVDDLKLPTFNVADLEQEALQPGSMAKVVDCILALKYYFKWRKSSIGRLWKPGSEFKPPSISIPCTPLLNRESQSQSSRHFSKYEIKSHSVGKIEEHFCRRRAPDGAFNLENLPSSSFLSDSTSAWIHSIGQKLREVLQIKARNKNDWQAWQSPRVSNYIDVASLKSLSNFVQDAVADKQPEEVSELVEFLLKKLMEEFERCLLSQGKQMKQLRNVLRELLVREDRPSFRRQILETLAAGPGEELKMIVSQLQQIQIEEDKRVIELGTEKLFKDRITKQMEFQTLENKLEMVDIMEQEFRSKLELQKKEHDTEHKLKIKLLEVQLEQSRAQVEDIKKANALEIKALMEKNEKCKKLLAVHHEMLKCMKNGLNSMKCEVLKLQLENVDRNKSLCTQIQSCAAVAYHKILTENRELYNQVQDLKGSIRVYCRVRPFLIGQNWQSCVEYISQNGDIVVKDPCKHGRDAIKSFRFNKVYRDTASQEQVYLDTQPLIRSVLDGYNVSILAYGQTGSGKTYTMSGPSNAAKDTWGVNYRALSDLFQISDNRKDTFQYKVAVQMIEIYNEQVRDLLATDGLTKKLEIRKKSQFDGVNVPEANMLSVQSVADILEIMVTGQKNRAHAATTLNERSSRSHSILMVHVEGLDLASGSTLHGCLHLVDLAGSERIHRAEVSGDRLKETQHINKSLSALGDVISALAQKSSHIPYRNSKLTQLLQNSLGGNAKSLIFVHISPDVESHAETISTLKFAQRVTSIELGSGSAIKETSEVRSLKDQIESLKAIISKKDNDIGRLRKVAEMVKETNLILDTCKINSGSKSPEEHFGTAHHMVEVTENNAQEGGLSAGLLERKLSGLSLEGVSKRSRGLKASDCTDTGGFSVLWDPSKKFKLSSGNHSNRSMDGDTGSDDTNTACVVENDRRQSVYSHHLSPSLSCPRSHCHEDSLPSLTSPMQPMLKESQVILSENEFHTSVPGSFLSNSCSKLQMQKRRNKKSSTLKQKMRLWQPEQTQKTQNQLRKSEVCKPKAQIEDLEGIPTFIPGESTITNNLSKGIYHAESRALHEKKPRPETGETGIKNILLQSPGLSSKSPKRWL